MVRSHSEKERRIRNKRTIGDVGFYSGIVATVLLIAASAVNDQTFAKAYGVVSKLLGPLFR